MNESKKPDVDLWSKNRTALVVAINTGRYQELIPPLSELVAYTETHQRMADTVLEIHARERTLAILRDDLSELTGQLPIEEIAQLAYEMLNNYGLPLEEVSVEVIAQALAEMFTVTYGPEAKQNSVRRFAEAIGPQGD